MRLCRYPITLNNIGKRLLSLYNNNELSSYVTVTEINNDVPQRHSTLTVPRPPTLDSDSASPTDTWHWQCLARRHSTLTVPRSLTLDTDSASPTNTRHWQCLVDRYSTLTVPRPSTLDTGSASPADTRHWRCLARRQTLRHLPSMYIHRHHNFKHLD